MRNEAPILLVDACGSCLRILRFELEERGHRVILVQTGLEALDNVVAHQPKLIVCDTALPDVSWYDVMLQARELTDHAYLPVLALFADLRASRKGMIALEGGADDFIVRPFNQEVLALRIEQIIWRVEEVRFTWMMGDDRVTRIRHVRLQGGIEVDLDSGLVEREGERIALTVKEQQILFVLARKHGAFIPHHTILAKVWGLEYVDDLKYLRVWIGRLRRKLGSSVIENSRGVGYRVTAEAVTVSEF